MNTKLESMHWGATATMGPATVRGRLLVFGLSMLLAVGLSVDSIAEVPGVYDAFSDFSFVSNPTPDGVWSYGYTLGLQGTLNLYTTKDTEFSLSIWERPGVRDPNVIKNETGAPILVFGEILFPTSDFLHFHPGNGELSVIRWTAPTSGCYGLEASFKSLRIGGQNTTTDVHILTSSVPQAPPIFSGLINSNQDALDFTGAIEVSAGDFVDFVVGMGSNGNPQYDSTGVRAVFTPFGGAQVQIEAVISDVQQLVNQGGLDPGQANALTAKLQAALQKLNQGKVIPGINQLQAFMNQVNALITAGVLTNAQGELLIAAAEAIINRLLIC